MTDDNHLQMKLTLRVFIWYNVIGGFNVTLEVLQDEQRRMKIVAKLRAFADVTDEIVQVLKNVGIR